MYDIHIYPYLIVISPQYNILLNFMQSHLATSI
jgi:hypothetical protein